MGGQASTRAEWLRAVGADVPLEHKLEFRCEACKQVATVKELKRAGSLRCPECAGTDWTLIAVFRSKPVRRSSAATLFMGLALGDIALLGIDDELDVQERGVRQRILEPGVDARELKALFAMAPGERHDAVLTFLHRRELNRFRAVRELAELEGVDCLCCRGRYVPSVAIERHGIRGDVGQGDDATCSNRCRRRLREAVEARACPVCDKAFVPPPQPVIEKDWRPKEWHANGYCTKNCYEGRERLRTCGACRERYVIPKPNPLAKHPKKPKAWHEAGFCSKTCQEHPESFRDCGSCSKRFQVPVVSALSKKKPKPWHAAGFCSKTCRDDPAPAQLDLTAGALPQIPTRCSGGHTFEVPITHQGLRTTCPECRARVEVPVG